MEWLHLDPWITMVRLRRAVARRWVRRAVVVLMALVTGLAVVSLLRSAETARDRWGARRRVAVAQHDLQRGDVVRPESVVIRELPRAAVADAALGEVPVGRVVREPIAAGEPLVPTRLAPDGLVGLAALVPEGYRAVAVPAGPAGVPRLHPGDEVDLLAAVPTGDGVTAEPVPLAERAPVIDVGEASVTVAIPIPAASRVVGALMEGVVVMTLAGG